MFVHGKQSYQSGIACKQRLPLEDRSRKSKDGNFPDNTFDSSLSGRETHSRVPYLARRGLCLL